MTQLDLHPTDTPTDPSDILHAVCCDDDTIARCGYDMTDVPWASTTERETLPICQPCKDTRNADCDTLCPVAALRTTR